MRLAQRSTVEREAALEQCELCGTPIPVEHRHVLELATRDVKCACRPCGLLFERAEKLKLIPTDVRRLDDVELDWEELRLPVDIAFFFRTGGTMKAYYPSPMGPTESQLELDAWEALEAANPVLTTLVPDVEALLVNRSLGARQHWIVPIDECYELVGLIRTAWRGFTGGAEVWQGIRRRFEELDRRSRPASRSDAKGAR